MTTTYSDSALAPRSSFGSSELRTLLIQPLLVVGVSTFWLVTLPFVAVSLLWVKVWDAIACHRTNPLILRRGPAAKGVPDPQHRTGPARAAHV